MIPTITKENLPEIRELLQHMVCETFPNVTFTDIWVRGRESWYGDEVVDIWSVYEGDVGQIDPDVRNRFGVRVLDALRELGITASPVTRFITKADVGDRIPEGFDLEDMGREAASSWAWRVAERSPKRRDGRRSREASR
ncbi:hypothetical protein [Candidatus Palauibacter sp.]|uniref:hypothetical protein n=1 Tax=Candidatus Palauibacter sp. TaxID=3101350 RepID=UPI003AF22B23